MSAYPRRLLTLAVAAASAGFASQSIAETLEKVQVTAQHTRGVEAIIDAEQLALKQANDMEDIFSGTPEVSVGGGLGVAQKLYVRGIEDTNLNVTVDGAVQSGYLFHHQGRVSVEPELLREVEVQAGAGLATDGAGALGGAIRFETVDPADLLREGEKGMVLLKGSYGSNADLLKGNVSVAGKASEQFSALVSLTKQDSDSFDDGHGDEVANTETDIETGFFKLVATPTSDQKVTLSHEVRRDDGERNLRSHFIAADWNPEREQENHRETTTLNWDFNPASELVDIEATVYHTDAYLTQIDDEGRQDGAGVKSTGADLRNTLRQGKHRLVFGGDFRRDTGYYINPEEPVRDEKAYVTGLYLQDYYQLTEKLELTAGARYDHYRLTDTEEQTFSASGVSPNIGASYQLTEALTLHGGYAQALRGQKVKEAYLLGYATNSADLKEEKADNLEVGLSYALNGLSLEGTAYISHIDDFVERVDRRTVDNAGDIETRGFTLAAGYEWDNTTVDLSFNYNRPELAGEPLSDGDMSAGTATGDKWVADVQHLLPEHNLTLGWTGTFVHRLTDVATGRSEKAGYGRHDVYVRWLPTASDDLALTLTVNNLLDKAYQDHGSYGISTSSGNRIGLLEPGRDIRLSVAARF